MNRSINSLFAVLILLASCGNAYSQIFDNGDPSGGFGTAVLSERDSINQVADDFDVATAADFGKLQWWGVGAGQQFSLRIFNTVKGVPSSTPLHVIDLGIVSGTPVTFGGGEIFEYNTQFTAVNLASGDYALSIVETTAGNDWFWSASCEDGCEGESYRRATDADAWSTGNWKFAFVASVPEPSPLPGDANGDGVLDFIDVSAFLQALFDPAAYATAYPGVDPDVVLDMNNDGVLDFLDVTPFITALGF